MYPTTATAISKPPDSRIRPAKLALEVPEAELDWVKEKLPADDDEGGCRDVESAAGG